MSRELFTTWADYQTAIDRVLALATKRICIYDEDLGLLHLETPERLAALKAPFASAGSDCLRIALRNVAPLQQRHPLLLRLLATHGHKCAMQQTADQLAHLRDSMILVDDAHAVIRFDRDQPRGKLLVDESDEVMPYRRRFEEIWAEGGTPVAATTLGL
jgi:hypothetical protein